MSPRRPARDRDSLYETDIVTWAERQAAALRSLASRMDLPNELDLLNVVEEIEDVANGQLRSVNRFMRLILSHLILIAIDADADSVPHWTREVATFRGDLMQACQRGMDRRIDTHLIWRRAAEEAALKLSTYHGIGTTFDVDELIGRPGSNPLVGIDDLRGESFKFHGLVERLRAHLARDEPC
jgi:Domain of unknown function DUF29